MHALIRAKYLLNHANSHAILGSDFDIMIAIHNLDNAIESLLRTIIDILNIEVNKSTDFYGLIKGINDELDARNSSRLPRIAHIKRIHEIRNLVQHDSLIPKKDAIKYIGNGVKFFDDCLKDVLGTNREDLRISSLVGVKELASRLKSAENEISQGHYLEAIVSCRNAFELAVFIYESRLTGLWRPGTIAKLKQYDWHVYEFVSKFEKKVRICGRYIDYEDYDRFMDLLEMIPNEHRPKLSQSYHPKKQEWTQEEAEFSYSLVSEAILHWQNSQFNQNRISVPDDLLDVVDSDKKEFIEGVEIQVYSISPGGQYFGDESSRHFYLEENAKDSLERAINNKRFVTFSHKRETTAQYPTGYWLVEVIDFNFTLVLSDPAFWEVMLTYREIPFTWRSNKDISRSKFVDIDNGPIQYIKNMINNEIIFKEFEDFRTTQQPLDTPEKAFALKAIFKGYTNEFLRSLLSPALILALEEQ